MRINWLCRSFWLQRWQWLLGSFRPAVPRMHVRARRVRAARKKRKCTNHGARAIVVGTVKTEIRAKHTYVYMVGRVCGVWGCGCQRGCNCDSEGRAKNMDMPAIRYPSGIINLPGFSGDDDQHKQSISIPSRWSHIKGKLLR